MILRGADARQQKGRFHGIARRNPYAYIDLNCMLIESNAFALKYEGFNVNRLICCVLFPDFESLKKSPALTANEW